MENQKERKNKHLYYLDIAKEIASRSTCIRRGYGAVIVKNDEIISTGYNGSPRECVNCSDIGKCRREELNIPPGERYELCKSVHAEMNAIISAPRERMIDATLYLYGIDFTLAGYIVEPNPCDLCKKLLINAGIARVITHSKDNAIKTTYTSEYIKSIDNL